MVEGGVGKNTRVRRALVPCGGLYEYLSCAGAGLCGFVCLPRAINIVYCWVCVCQGIYGYVYFKNLLSAVQTIILLCRKPAWVPYEDTEITAVWSFWLSVLLQNESLCKHQVANFLEGYYQPVFYTGWWYEVPWEPVHYTAVGLEAFGMDVLPEEVAVWFALLLFGCVVLRDFLARALGGHTIVNSVQSREHTKLLAIIVSTFVLKLVCIEWNLSNPPTRPCAFRAYLHNKKRSYCLDFLTIGWSKSYWRDWLKKIGKQCHLHWIVWEARAWWLTAARGCFS